MRELNLWPRLLFGLAVACSPARPDAQPAQGSGRTYLWHADHHMHVATADLCTRIDECTIPVIRGTDALAALDSAGVRRGVLLSSAYLYGIPSLKLPADSVSYWTRSENEFTAAQVAADTARLVGFLSVNPLSNSALAELEHWKGSQVLVGLKMHLYANGVNLKRADHVEKLTRVVRAAAGQGSPMVIHVGGGDFDSADAETFVRSVLPAAGTSWVQLAHAAGGVFTGPRAHPQVLRVFADHIAQGDSRTTRVLFDISFVPAPTIDQQEIDELMVEIRRIGIDRFLFASDFDVQTPRTQVASLDRLGLTSAERQALEKSCAPWTCQ